MCQHLVHILWGCHLHGDAAFLSFHNQLWIKVQEAENWVSYISCPFKKERILNASWMFLVLVGICYSLRHDTAMLQVKFLKAVLECTRPPYSNFAFSNSALLPTGIQFSKDLDLSWHFENQELFTALSSFETRPRTPGEASTAWQETIEWAGCLFPPAKSKSL